MWHKTLLLLAFSAGLSACRSAPAQPVPAAPAEGSEPATANALAEPAREVLNRYCGSCHDGALPTANPGALRIYDLSRPDWSAGLTLDQMQSILRRLGEPVPPDGEIDRVPPNEAQAVIDYLEAEAGRRWRLSP